MLRRLITNLTVGDLHAGSLDLQEAFWTFNGVNKGDTSPVPEPAIWLTLAVGFAAAGSALRRNRPIQSLRAG